MKTVLKKTALAVSIATLAACSAVPEEGAEGAENSPLGITQSDINDYLEGKKLIDIVHDAIEESDGLDGEGVSIAFFSSGFDYDTDYYDMSNLTSESARYTKRLTSGEFETDTDLSITTKYTRSYGSCFYSLLNTDSYGKLLGGADLTAYVALEEGLAIHDKVVERLSDNAKLEVLAEVATGKDFLVAPGFSHFAKYTTQAEKDIGMRHLNSGTAIISAGAGYDKDVTYWVDDSDMRDSMITVSSVRADYLAEVFTGSSSPNIKNRSERHLVVPDAKYGDMRCALSDEGRTIAQFSSRTTGAISVVTAAAGMVKQKFPQLSNAAVLQVLLDTAFTGFEYYDELVHGQGILNIKAALSVDPTQYED